MKCWYLAGNVGAWLLDLGPSPHVARESGEVALAYESSCLRPRPSHRRRETPATYFVEIDRSTS
jgi:hypothetical protein